MMDYQRPIPGAWITATYQQHRRRRPPSVEPGIDYGSPIGTTVYAPADGVVHATYYSGPVAGMAVFIRFNDGNWGRAIHLHRYLCTKGQRLKRGDPIAQSGTAGDGPHLHWTFWEQPDFIPLPGVTIPQDFEAFLARQSGSPAGGGSKPFDPPTTIDEDDDMIYIASPGRGAAVVALGQYRPLTTSLERDVAKLAASKVFDNLNDAQFDALVQVCSTSRGNADMVILTDGTRQGIVGAGLGRVARSDEEASQLPTLTNRVLSVNARQFDLLIDIANG